MATIVVVEDLAAPAVIHQGGQTIRVLQVLAGLERIGHDAYFLEFLDREPGEEAVRYFSETMERWWRLDRAALIGPSIEILCGLAKEAVGQLGRSADAIITLAAHYRSDPYPLLENIRPRILIEQDPAYTHLWAAAKDAASIFGIQDLYFTVGGNIGTAACRIPTLGISWQPVWNPVLLDWWRDPVRVSRDRFTTIADWRSYGYLEYEGQLLGPKAEEFRKFLRLPELAGEQIEIALRIDAADPDVALLAASGWRLEDPAIVRTPESYREYVMGSFGEFSCAKGGYVGTRSGWFSDRSACYLAAGRPVVLQSTGFEDLLPTGVGVLAVKSVEEAAEAVRMIRRDYQRHSTAARQIAAEHFDSGKILRAVLNRAGIRSS